MEKISSPGAYKISSEEYHGDPCIHPCLSRGVIADLIYHNPAYARHYHPCLNPNLEKEEPEDKFDLGVASHFLLLEGIDKALVVDAKDWRKDEAKAKKELARAEDKIPLLRYQYDKVLQMIRAAENQIILCTELKILNLRTEGESEVTYIWEEDGVWLKVRLDWISHDKTLAIDYKSTGMTANPFDIGRTVISTAGDIQEALYRRGAKVVNGIDPRFIFVRQETEAPYLCSFTELPGMVKTMGSQKVENGIYLWKECMKDQKWFGYPNKVVTIDTPHYAVVEWDRRCGRIGQDVEIAE